MVQVIVSNSCWYLDVSVYTLNCSLLVDSDTACTIINSSLYYDLPRPRPRLGEPKLHFKIADSRVLHLLGVMT